MKTIVLLLALLPCVCSSTAESSYHHQPRQAVKECPAPKPAAFISTSVKNRTTTTNLEKESCAIVMIVEIDEVPVQYCDTVTFNMVCMEPGSMECIQVAKTVLEDKVEALCVDQKLTACNEVVDTEVVFTEEMKCNKACSKDCTVSTVTSCQDGSRQVEEMKLNEECKEEFKDECVDGPEECNLEVVETCHTPSAPSEHENPYQDAHDTHQSRHKRSYKEECTTVKNNNCQVKQKCHQVPFETCKEDLVSVWQEVPTCQCKEVAVQQCLPREEEVCQVVLMQEIKQTRREICTDTMTTVCEDNIISVPITKSEEVCVDLSTKTCHPFTREVCITVINQQARLVEKEVCTKVPDATSVSTSESFVTQLKKEAANVEKEVTSAVKETPVEKVETTTLKSSYKPSSSH
eukprot:GFUD01027867.1.p1 GENE.GFUD01027867.1~~GFUD01027867.1.p1  ORF type:complete len:405 (+),score=106.98 GFUD01027867.1:94-1308(+)